MQVQKPSSRPRKKVITNMTQCEQPTLILPGDLPPAFKAQKIGGVAKEFRLRPDEMEPEAICADALHVLRQARLTDPELKTRVLNTGPGVVALLSTYYGGEILKAALQLDPSATKDDIATRFGTLCAQYDNSQQ